MSPGRQPVSSSRPYRSSGEFLSPVGEEWLQSLFENKSGYTYRHLTVRHGARESFAVAVGLQSILEQILK